MLENVNKIRVFEKQDSMRFESLDWYMTMAYATFMKIVRLFKNGRSQAVRLPKEYRFGNSKEVKVRRKGRSIILEPVEEFSWDRWWDRWQALGDEFMPEGRRQPRMQKRDIEFD